MAWQCRPLWTEYMASHHPRDVPSRSNRASRMSYLFCSSVSGSEDHQREASVDREDGIVSLINGIWKKELNSIACLSLPPTFTSAFRNIKYYLFHSVFFSFSFHHHHHHHLKSFLRSIKVNVIDNNIYNFRVFIAIHLIFSSRIQSVFFHFCLCFSHSYSSGYHDHRRLLHHDLTITTPMIPRRAHQRKLIIISIASNRNESNADEWMFDGWKVMAWRQWRWRRLITISYCWPAYSQPNQ